MLVTLRGQGVKTTRVHNDRPLFHGPDINMHIQEQPFWLLTIFFSDLSFLLIDLCNSSFIFWASSFG